MNDEQVKVVLGALTGIAFLALLVRSVWIGVPLADRTLAIFAVLLWAYLQIDISAALPFLTLDTDSGGDSDPAADDDRED